MTGSPLVKTALAFPPEFVKKNSANRVSKNSRSPMLAAPKASLSKGSSPACTRKATASDPIENRTNKTVFVVSIGSEPFETDKGFIPQGVWSLPDRGWTKDGSDGHGF